MLDEIECKATLPKITCIRGAKHMTLFTCLQITFSKDFWCAILELVAAKCEQQVVVSG